MNEYFQPVSNNFTERQVNMIILHSIWTDLDTARDILSGRTELETSAHYLITRAGEVEQLYDYTVRTWHAGLAYWAGFTDVNSMSIGIELEDKRSEGDIQTPDCFTEIQMDALCRVLEDIQTREGPQFKPRPVRPANFLGHQDVTPYRKIDPGPRFDWAYLAGKGFGLWHDLQPVKDDKIMTDEKAVAKFRTDLTLFGYDPRPNAEGKDYSHVIRAFQTHFLPWNICGQVTEQSMQALDILLQKKFA